MDTAAWPYGRGEMAERIRTFNWASTPLGPILSWPQSLKTAVEVMLGSGFPLSMQWGKEAILLYNDANARILGSLHPAALGRPIFEALPARRPSWEPVLRRVLTGESVVFGEQRRLLHEDGVERERSGSTVPQARSATRQARSSAFGRSSSTLRHMPSDSGSWPRTRGAKPRRGRRSCSGSAMRCGHLPSRPPSRRPQDGG